MSETNIYAKGFDPVVGCSGYVAGVNTRKIRAMQYFNKHGKKRADLKKEKKPIPKILKHVA